MNQLTKYLIGELLDGKTVTAVYGGGFKPPTKGHFDLVKKALDDNKEIDKFIIYVGGGVRDGITQEQSMQIWQLYKEILGNKVEIVPSKNPIGDVLRYAKNTPEEKVYFVIGAREGREDDLADVAQRTTGVEEKYPNTEVKLIITPGGEMSGTNARKALKSGNKAEFFTFLPDKVPAAEKENIWDLLNDALVKETEGKAAPFGSGYKEVNEIGVKLSNYSGQVLQGDVVRAPKGFPLGGKKLEKSLELKVKKISREGVNRYKLSLEDSDGKNYTVRNYQMDGEYKGEKLPKWGLVRKSKENINENTIPSIDIVQKCAELTQHMIDKGYNIQPLPTVKFIGDDMDNAEDFLGKTAYYDPQEKTIVLYTYGRHPKDIARSFAHEMIHHMQNLEGRLDNITTTDTTEDANLNDLEKEANLLGTMTFRNYTDGLQKTQVNENILANIIAKIAAPLVNYIISTAIDGLFGYIDDIKNIVAPKPYIKFLKGLEKNDEFNKQFIELIVRRDKEKNTPLGNEWRELTTNLPAFKEAFDKFAEEQGIEDRDKSNLLSKISITMWDTYLRAWKEIHKTLKKKYPDLTQDLREGSLVSSKPKKAPKGQFLQNWTGEEKVVK